MTGGAFEPELHEPQRVLGDSLRSLSIRWSRDCTTND